MMHTSFGGYERIITPQKAIEKILSFADEQGFKVDYSSVGMGLETTTCQLSKIDGTFAVGRGKGVGPQSSASAIFEAFEHYYYKYEDKNSRISAEKLNIRSHADLGKASPDFQLIFSQEQMPLSCFEFRGVVDKDDAINFPICLTDPAYQANREDERRVIAQTRIYRYSSNSGTASGLNINEAILHGILELIERDAIGIAFIRSIISNTPRPVRQIAPASLPESIKKMIFNVESSTDGKIIIWDITTDINVPSILCALRVGNPLRYQYFGSGASLHPEYAIERAILEALQVCHIQDILNFRVQSNFRRDVDRMSMFQRCCLDAGYFEYRGGHIEIEFSDIMNIINNENNYDIMSQINIINSALNRCDIHSYYRTIHDNGISVVQVIAPRLERMFLLSHGIPVAPSSRGRFIMANV